MTQADTARIDAVHAPAGDPVRRGRYDRFGGISVGAVFVGWLVSVALPILLTGLLASAAAVSGAALGISRADAQDRAATIGFAVAAALLVFVAIGYFAGGYVAGRMTRFDAGRQGVAVWGLSVVVSMALVVSGGALSARYDVPGLTAFARPAGAVDVRGVVALVLVALTTLLLAFLGARVGQSFHHRIDD